MGNLLQKNLANNIVKNTKEFRWKTLKDLLIASGYSVTNASKNQKAIIQHKGVQERLVELGFNEDAARAAISEILLLGEESNRLRAADMVLKVFGTYAPEKHLVGNINILELVREIQNEES